MGFSFLEKLFSRPWFVLILIGFSVFTIYSNIYNSPFVFDDEPRIVENKNIKNLSNYLSPSKLLKPRAVVDLTFALNYRFDNLNVFGYHLTNFAIHAINAILIWWLVLMTFSTPIIKENPIHKHTQILALFAGLLFVSHPIQTQAVTYIVQQLAALATMFYLLTLAFYTQGRLKNNKYGFFTAAGITAVLGMLTKEIVFTLPFILI